MNGTGPLRRPRPDSGEALVEFALVLPILLVLSLGMMDFGRAFHTKALLDQAAREGCRVAIVIKPLDNSIIVSRVDAVLAAGGIKRTSLIVNGPSVDQMITVTVGATFKFVTPGVFTLIGAKFDNTLSMTGESTMRYEAGGS